MKGCLSGCFGKIKTGLKWSAYGFAGILVLGIAGALLSGDEQPDATPTPGRSGVVVIPSQTPVIDTSMSSTSTSPPVSSPVPSSTPQPTSTPLPSATPLPTNTPAPTLTPSLSQQASDFEAVLRAISDLDLFSVQIADGRDQGGERSLLVTYRSTAQTERDLAGEWGMLFGTTGSAMRERGLDIDSVTIIIGDPSGNTAGTVVAAADDVLAFTNEEMSAEDFFNTLQIDDFSAAAAPEEPAASGVSNNTVNVQSVDARTYYVIAQANLRTCAQIDNAACPVTRTLPANAALTVTGTTQGDAFQGSTLWYQADVDGETLYLHSGLVSQTQQTTTSSSSSSGSSSGDSSGSTTQRPANCDEAVAMGLSAVEAAQWSHLDRDNDGVACYGD